MKGYDLGNRRWPIRPMGFRWSDMVLGRMACHRTLLAKGVIKVSCYDYEGRCRYSDPVTHAPKKGTGVRYRIIVKLKGKPND